jgi:hypothetical protein
VRRSRGGEPEPDTELGQAFASTHPLPRFPHSKRMIERRELLRWTRRLIVTTEDCSLE